jgi:hypothetical protein
MSPEEIHIFNNMSRLDQLMCFWNVLTAINLSKEIYPLSQHNGKGDAFRHAYFSALNAKGLELLKHKNLVMLMKKYQTK